MAFLGQPARDVDGITEAMRDCAGEPGRRCSRPPLPRDEERGDDRVRGRGGTRATRLAERVFAALEGLGVYERERRAWLPHVTVARFRERPRLGPQLPELGG